MYINYLHTVYRSGSGYHYSSKETPQIVMICGVFLCVSYQNIQSKRHAKRRLNQKYTCYA